MAGTNRTMVDELAQQQEVLRANLELVQGEWAQAKEQLNAWHGEVTAAFDHMQVAQVRVDLPSCTFVPGMVLTMNRPDRNKTRNNSKP